MINSNSHNKSEDSSGFTCIFTIRRILHELGGIQSSVALPSDDAFDQKNNTYNVPSYKRLCNEFGISPSTDFRFHQGMNEGLGNVYIYYSNFGYGKSEASYPGNYKFSEEDGKASDGNLIQYITNASSENQYEHFVVPLSYGLTKAGQARINQSIEAFVYCILGAQVNVRSGILGNSGSAQEVRREFLVLMEDVVKQPDICKYVQRFQLAVQEAKVKLDLAISPGTRLMPSRMVINTESTVGYNNKLKRVTTKMKLGVNSDVNADGTVSVGIKHNLGTSKKKLPHAIPHMLRNVGDSVAMESLSDKTIPKTVKRIQTQHQTNIIVTIAAAAIAWMLFR